MADLDLQEIHDFLITIAYKAGEMITAAHPSTGAAGSKKNCKTSNAFSNRTLAPLPPFKTPPTTRLSIPLR